MVFPKPNQGIEYQGLESEKRKGSSSDVAAGNHNQVEEESKAEQISESKDSTGLLLPVYQDHH
jgi:hypothetical protein